MYRTSYQYYIFAKDWCFDLWNEGVKNNIIANNGSIQLLDMVQENRDKYKTVWEIPMRELFDMSADRAVYPRV